MSTEIQLNNPSILPTVDAHLRIELKSGKTVEGKRLEYIQRATKDEPGYRDRCGNSIQVDDIVGWYYQAWSE